jgi:hypothetical protein
MITVMIEPDDWLTKALQGSRRLVIVTGTAVVQVQPIGRVEGSQTSGATTRQGC